MEELIAKLKVQIIAQLNLEDLTPDDIDPKAPLFGDGLGLDSIDALEPIVLLEREYGIKIDDPSEGKKIFISVETMAQFITDYKKA
ncbi:MAG: acyl carrier protein [Bacteroidales bacterium]|nr:acyl carrier protein [Bacteroidales bacterium]